MKLCIAGKNNIAVDVIEHLLSKLSFPTADLYVIPYQTADCETTFQRSFKQYAEHNHLQIVSLEDMYSIKDLIFLSLEYGKLIRTENFKSDKLYNIHFSHLPQYKGMYTSAWPIINQDKETGVSLHAIDDGIDTGDIVAQKTFPVNKHDTARSLYFKYILHGTELIKSQLENLLSGSVLPKPQLADGSSYYARKSIDYQGTLLDLNQVAVSIAAQVRAYNFREYQLPQVQGHSIIDTTILTTRAFAPPGTLLQETENKLVIATIDYDIALIKDNFEVLLSTAKTNDTNKLRASLENTAAAINNTNSHGWTPLIVATYHANHDAFTALLESGADTSCTNINGTTLLMYAKEGYVQTGNDQVLRGCCRMNLDPRMQDYKGLTIFDYCNQNNQSNVLDILREYYD